MAERPFPTWGEVRRQATAAVDCSRCGLCCELTEGALTCSEAEVRRWLREGRADVLRHVRHRLDAGGGLLDFDREIWLEAGPQPRFPVLRCPFLACTWEAGFRCTIWPTRPHVCADLEIGGERCREARLRLQRR